MRAGGLLRELTGHPAAGVVDQRGGERLRLLAQRADVCAVDCVAGPLADALVLALVEPEQEPAFSERSLEREVGVDGGRCGGEQRQVAFPFELVAVACWLAADRAVQAAVVDDSERTEHAGACLPVAHRDDG